jgi:hydroxyethylthiazole kinase-like uncharacterized protein yjeF
VEILTGEQMRRIDRRATEEHGIAGLALMDGAGTAVADALERDFPEALGSPLLVLCGKGNNGGDGLVAARVLASRGHAVEVWILSRGETLPPDAAASLAAARAAGVPIEEVRDEAGWWELAPRLAREAWVLDALLGTGVRGGARGLPASAIAALADRDARVISIDVPSGLDADTGRLDGPAVQARHTYTLARPKQCLVVEPAASRTRSFSVVDIGIPAQAIAAEGADLLWIDAEAARGLWPARDPRGHKGSFGHLLVVAGSRGKSGAAVLAARGALRAGAGLVTAAVPRSVQPLVAVQQAEIMSEGLDEDGDGALHPTAAGPAIALARARDAVAMGPGLGTAAGTGAFVRAFLARCEQPVVIDADALNVLAPWDARDRVALRFEARATVLTPHPGEAARLLGTTVSGIEDDRIGAARHLAMVTGAIVVLKGRRTVVASPRGGASLNASGNAGMATGGTGDVLTGVLGALLARGLPALEAAMLAAYAHGDAGDRAAAQLGQDGMIAGDVVRHLPHALRALAGFERQ